MSDFLEARFCIEARLSSMRLTWAQAFLGGQVALQNLRHRRMAASLPDALVPEADSVTHSTSALSSIPDVGTVLRQLMPDCRATELTGPAELGLTAADLPLAGVDGFGLDQVAKGHQGALDGEALPPDVAGGVGALDTMQDLAAASGAMMVLCATPELSEAAARLEPETYEMLTEATPRLASQVVEGRESDVAELAGVVREAAEGLLQSTHRTVQREAIIPVVDRARSILREQGYTVTTYTEDAGIKLRAGRGGEARYLVRWRGGPSVEAVDKAIREHISERRATLTLERLPGPEAGETAAASRVAAQLRKGA